MTQVPQLVHRFVSFLLCKKKTTTKHIRERKITIRKIIGCHFTSKMGSPVNLDRAAISRIIVPAQAVHVSLVNSGKFGFIPLFKLTWNSIKKTKSWLDARQEKMKSADNSFRSITHSAIRYSSGCIESR